MQIYLFINNKKIKKAKDKTELIFINAELELLKSKILFINGVEKYRANKYMSEVLKIKTKLKERGEEVEFL